MTSLVALISTGKGTWSEPAKIIKLAEWEKVYIITNEFGKNTLSRQDNMEIILINPESPIEDIITDIKKGLDGKIMDLEVALNIASGTGKEHMAILSALIKLGLGIRIVTISNDSLKDI